MTKRIPDSQVVKTKEDEKAILMKLIHLKKLIAKCNRLIKKGATINDDDLELAMYTAALDIVVDQLEEMFSLVEKCDDVSELFTLYSLLLKDFESLQIPE